MSGYLKLPSSVESQCRDWRLRIVESCPFINAAVNYIETRDVPIEFIRLDVTFSPL